MKIKKETKPVIQEIPKTKEYILNEKKFSYHSISFANFHKFQEAFSVTMKPEINTPFLMIQSLFASEAALDMVKLILLDDKAIQPEIEFLKTVSPVLILEILTDFFDSEGVSLLNGIFALIHSIQ